MGTGKKPTFYFLCPPFPPSFHDNVLKWLFVLQGMLTESSGVLNEALGGRVYLKQVTLVVPSTWSEARCQMAIKTPTGNTAFRVSRASPSKILL